MNRYFPLYTWLREGASIYLGSIDRETVEASRPGMERREVTVRVSRALVGPIPQADLRFSVEQPLAREARLKFRHPVWGGVDLDARPPLLLVTHRAGDDALDPWHVEPAPPGDPSIAAIEEVVRAEAHPEPRARDRLARYLTWLAPSRHPALRLFAAEAVAREAPLLAADSDGTDQKIRIAAALARVVTDDRDPYVRLAVATWMWGPLWPGVGQQAREAITASAISGIHDADEDVRRFSIAQLLTAGSAAYVTQPDRSAAQALRARLQEVGESERERVEALITRLSP